VDSIKPSDANASVLHPALRGRSKCL